MEPLLVFNGTPATRCVASATHNPVPLRYVYHHVQPRETGGPTTTENLRACCDSCHYTIHRLLWYMRLRALGQVLTPAQEAELAHPPRQAQLALAKTGFAACVAAGTVEKIPNEG